MNEPTTNDEVLTADRARTPSAYGLGLLAGLGFAIAYGIAAEAIGLSWGLLAVGFFGGWIIGGAVGYGAWSGSAHVRVTSLQVGAAAIAGAAWLLALVIAYVVSQSLIPQATTGLLERVSLGGFFDYLGGTFDYVRLIHVLAFALLAIMAWRGAR